MPDVIRLDTIHTRPPTKEYREGWERIFLSEKPKEVSNVSDVKVTVHTEK